MRVFVTGGSGFLGGWIVRRLRVEQAEIVALVRSSSPSRHLRVPGVTLHHGDLRDLPSLVAGMHGCMAVVHSASPKGGWRHPEVYASHTIAGTHNLLAAMSIAGVRTLIAISTISIHGLDPLTQTLSDDSGIGQRFLPYDHYGQAKAVAEQMIAAAHGREIIEATSLRLGWLYGPEDQRSYGRMARRLGRGFFVRIGNGHNHIPLVYAPNAAGAVWQALRLPGKHYRSVLYATDSQITQNELLASLARAAGRTKPIPTLPRRLLLALAAANEHLAAMAKYRLPVLVTRYFLHLLGSDWQVSQQRLGAVLGYTPEVTPSEGLAATEQWYQQQDTPGAGQATIW
jgi:nucleoside-diphosphate-sugar epimerase